jgi:hypothetical protein
VRFGFGECAGRFLCAAQIRLAFAQVFLARHHLMVEFVEPGGSLGACARGWRQVAQAFVEGTHLFLVGGDLGVELPEALSRAREFVAVFGKPLFGALQAYEVFFPVNQSLDISLRLVIPLAAVPQRRNLLVDGGKRSALGVREIALCELGAQRRDDLLLFVQRRVFAVDLLNLALQPVNLRLHACLFSTAVFERGNLAFDCGNLAFERIDRSQCVDLGVDALQFLARRRFVIVLQQAQRHIVVQALRLDLLLAADVTFCQFAFKARNASLHVGEGVDTRLDGANVVAQTLRCASR